MNKSENIAALAAALVKAQAQMSGAKKTAKNPFFKSTYANLEEVIHCVKEPFADNDLAFVQFPITGEDRAGVETIIMHSSGEWVSSEFTLKCVKHDPQGMGSAITYARRYGLQSAAGIPSEDDDANAATQKAAPVNDKAPIKAETSAPCSDVQKENINSLIAKAELPPEKVEKGVAWASGGNASFVTDLTIPQAAKFIKFLSDKAQIQNK